jgi:hypothetical protein
MQFIGLTCVMVAVVVLCRFNKPVATSVTAKLGSIVVV